MEYVSFSKKKIFNMFIVEYEVHIFFRWQILIYYFTKIKIFSRDYLDKVY